MLYCITQGNFPFSFQDHNSSDNFKGGQSMTHAGALGSNILGVCCWYTIAYLMYRANFFYNL